jgi:hypothetical protein
VRQTSIKVIEEGAEISWLKRAVIWQPGYPQYSAPSSHPQDISQFPREDIHHVSELAEAGIDDSALR